MIKIGADPEFLLYNIRDGEHFVPARHVLVDSRDTRVGCDGASDTGELRPKEAPTAPELWNNTRLLIKKLAQQARPNEYKAVAGNGYSLRHPTGGHIHFSGVSSKVTPYLDLLSVATLHIEQPKYAKARRYNYGHLNDVRSQTWGFEYRTPASWLVNPRVAMGVLCANHAIAYDYAHGTLVKKNPGAIELIERLPDYTIRSAFNSANTAPFKAWLPVIFRMLKRTYLYNSRADYKKFINAYIAQVRSGDQWLEGTNIIRAWKAMDVIIQHNLFRWNGDQYLPQIKDAIGSTTIEVDLKKTSGPLSNFYVYGLREDRDEEFSTNSEQIANIIREYFPGANIDLQQPQTPPSTGRHYNGRTLIWTTESITTKKEDSIGIHFYLRKYEQERVTELLKRLYEVKRTTIGVPA